MSVTPAAPITTTAPRVVHRICQSVTGPTRVQFVIVGDPLNDDEQKVLEPQLRSLVSKHGGSVSFDEGCHVSLRGIPPFMRTEVGRSAQSVICTTLSLLSTAN